MTVFFSFRPFMCLQTNTQRAATAAAANTHSDSLRTQFVCVCVCLMSKSIHPTASPSLCLLCFASRRIASLVP